MKGENLYSKEQRTITLKFRKGWDKTFGNKWPSPYCGICSDWSETTEKCFARDQIKRCGIPEDWLNKDTPGGLTSEQKIKALKWIQSDPEIRKGGTMKERHALPQMRKGEETVKNLDFDKARDSQGKA